MYVASFEASGEGGDHVWTLKLRQLRMERQADKCQQHGYDGNGFFHDFGFLGLYMHG